MAAGDHVQAWRPRVPGVAEVLHAAWRDHAYPSHTHDTWTLLVVDHGLIGYELDRHGHAAPRSGVTILPPGVVHDGRPATSAGFRKRVVYLEQGALAGRLVGAAVDAPLVPDATLREQVSRLDRALVRDDDLEAESRLALVVERLTWHLAGRPDLPAQPVPAVVARRARELLDDDPVGIGGVAAVAEALGVTTAHLVRSFTRSYGLPPHQYVLGRRLDLARHRLLDGEPAVQVATAAGFYDQAHLTRHFRRFLATTPGRFQAGRRAER
ncbi:AraC family transcriptional regulator [Luteimicrobium sp. NPDC057192]|uniref:AraC family transcriptional regulator n=1 Tax=Luteimicrobium sp. NPDC057192 TaxID=3346042 RepID=UPI00363CB3EE